MSALEGRQRRAGDMSEQSMRGQFGIGEVLGQLRPEFPDISTSKIRFLEAEGLIEPARSRSGYRRFSAADIERLRYILTMQRDSYLPLRVIRERLAMKKAGEVGGEQANGVPPAGRAPADMTRRQLLDAAEISEAELTELEDYGLIRRVGRQYGGDALAVARALAALRQYGVQARHLRAVKAAADREANLVEQVVAPQLRQRGPGARDAAARTAWQIADLTLRLHATLVESALAEAGLASAPLRAGDYEFEALEASGSSPTSDATEPAAGGLRSASGRLRVYLGKGSGGQTEVPQAREDGAVVRQMEVIGVRVEMPSNSPIVLLKEAQGDRYLPIWIGAVEATAIAFAQQGMVSLRPLTHDLFRDVLEVLHVQLRTVNITALRDGIFYADLVFSNGAEVSARPSDSIALALRTGAQIFASEEILDEAGVAIPDEQEDEVEKFREFLDTISPEDFGRAT
jgi:bifunctional DNase/RNase/DNA-binding transcriptional MerR regulator